MSSDNGSPTTFWHGPAVRLTLDLPADVVRAVDAWIAEQQGLKPDRSEAILQGLRDWLIGLGKLPPGSDSPEGLH